MDRAAVHESWTRIVVVLLDRHLSYAIESRGTIGDSESTSNREA